VPAVAALAALLLASILAGCALGGRDDRSAVTTTRASDFRLADIRQAVVLVRVVVASSSRLSERDRKELSGAVSYALRPGVSVFGSVGRTFATLDANGAGTSVSGGLSVFFAAGGSRP